MRRDQLPLLAREADLGFASLLVGVNDAVQGIPEASVPDERRGDP